MDNNIKFLKIKQENGEFTKYPLGTVVGVKGEEEKQYQQDLVTITKESIGLGNVNNTADSEKNVSHANNADIANKAKELSHKLKFTGGIEAEFNGLEDKVIAIDKNTVTTALGYTPAGGEDVVVRSELGKTHVSKGKELPYTWNELRDMCNTGDFKDVQVGDYKTVTMKNKEIVVMEVAGIDTFYNTGGGETHGQFATTDYIPVPHHIDFISRDCIQTTSQWNLTDYNCGTGESAPDDGTDQPYLTSYIKKNVLEGTLLDNLPDEIKNVTIPKINILERRAHVDGTPLKESTGWHWYNMGKLWLPSEFEVFGTNIWGCKGFGSTQAVQYPLFANSWGHRIKGQGNGKGRCGWWLCSVYSGSSTLCCFVATGGYAGTSGAGSSRGVPVCFRVAAKNKL